MAARRALLAAMMAALVPAGAALAAAIDWTSVADEAVIQIITRDEDGDVRETKIWLAVVDGSGYVRTGGTRWFANIERDPNVVLRIAGTEYPLRAELVDDEGVRSRVETAFREKYGFQDRVAGWFSFGEPKIMQAVPRPTE